MNRLSFKTNNRGRLELTQEILDDNVNILRITANGALLEHKQISPGDMVMLINYYYYVKRNNLQCDFINPHGKYNT